MLDNNEQLEAASGHALKIVTRQWKAVAEPGDVVFATKGEELRGIAKTVADRLIVTFQNVRMRFCSHIIARPAQPVFCRSWLMSRAMCERCLPPTGIRIPIDFRCDHCHKLNYRPGIDKTKRHNVQIWNAGPIAIYFALCDGCTDTMTAELTPGATEVAQ